MAINFQWKSHPRIEERKSSGPVKSEDQAPGINGKIAVFLTRTIGTMWCAYVFAALALFALPDAVKSHSLLAIIQWVSQTFIQLVMLSVIMVGQNILSQAGDRRAEMTFNDADATLHEAMEIQKHLKEQDEAINVILDRLEQFSQSLKMQTTTISDQTGQDSSP